MNEIIEKQRQEIDRLNLKVMEMGSSGRLSETEEIDSLKKEYQDKINILNKKYTEDTKKLAEKLRTSEDNAKKVLSLVKNTPPASKKDPNSEQIKNIKGKSFFLFFFKSDHILKTFNFFIYLNYIYNSN